MNTLFKLRIFANSFLKHSVLRCLSPGKLSTVAPDPPYKVLFFGSDEFALTCLQKIHSNYLSKNPLVSKLEVVCLPQSNLAIQKFALSENLTLHIWDNIPQAEEFDVGVVVSFGKLIPESLINRFRCKMINVHGSLLPALRGAAPISRAIERGFKSTGVTIIQLKPNKFDHGRILAQSQPVSLDNKCITKELYGKLSDIGADLCIKVLADLPNKLENATEQNPSDVTLAPKLTTDDSAINFSMMTDIDIWNKFRAFGYESNFYLQCMCDKQKLRLVEVTLSSEQQLQNIPENAVPGQVFFHKHTKSIVIKCKSGHIACTKLRLGGKTLLAQDFKNGYWQKEIKKGNTVIFTPCNDKMPLP